jgi:hypothetical protein
MVGLWDCHSRNMNWSCKIYTASMLCHNIRADSKSQTDLHLQIEPFCGVKG